MSYIDVMLYAAHFLSSPAAENNTNESIYVSHTCWLYYIVRIHTDIYGAMANLPQSHNIDPSSSSGRQYVGTSWKMNATSLRPAVCFPLTLFMQCEGLRLPKINWLGIGNPHATSVSNINVRATGRSIIRTGSTSICCSIFAKNI